MSYKVLIVDDSNFFQQRLQEAINAHPQLKVVGVAANGQEAIDLATKLKPDVISMDYEMPMMDGLTAVRAIMNSNPVPIVMFSSMTYEGARITLDALEAGAVDFMNKNFAEVSNNTAGFKNKLHEKLLAFAKGKTEEESDSPSPEVIRESIADITKKSSPEKQRDIRSREVLPTAPKVSEVQNLKSKVKLLAIGASTGGPVALSDIITKLPANFPIPIVIVQHMPENFTRAFSERLNRSAQLEVKEAEQGDRLSAGKVLVAPGGKQMIFDRGGNSVKIIDGDDRVNYRPCVDITFASAANIFNDQVLGVILTGMGQDGCEGARLLKQKGSSIWSQDQDSCVVYGMPAAVARANLSDKVLPLGGFSGKLTSAFS